jgi:predicted DNA-binding antitoxin AbrB/MazE fold protein
MTNYAVKAKRHTYNVLMHSWSPRMTIHAVYEKGVFRPLEPVALPERTKVLVTEAPASQLPEISAQDQAIIYGILRQRFNDPNSPGNLAERHNEPQP